MTSNKVVWFGYTSEGTSTVGASLLLASGVSSSDQALRDHPGAPGSSAAGLAGGALESGGADADHFSRAESSGESETLFLRSRPLLLTKNRAARSGMAVK